MNESYKKRIESSPQIVREVIEIARIPNQFKEEGKEKFLCCDGVSHWVTAQRIKRNKFDQLIDNVELDEVGEKTPCDCEDKDNRKSIWDLYKKI